jgi:hypothetical protein
LLAIQLAAVAEKLGVPLQEVNVLAAQNDPFRLDTPAHHRDAEWIANRLGGRTTHERGAHYFVFGETKPNGLPYTGSYGDWVWIQKAIKAARWLNYIPFEQITDQRNVPPVERIYSRPEPQPTIASGLGVEIPDIDDVLPIADVEDFTGSQRFHLVFFGEKSSLEPELDPLAQYFQADLYLPTGEISDSMLYRMAWRAVEDGRPLIVIPFSDCDPAGWQMPVSIAHKLRALKILHFPTLEFRVFRGALTPAQVKAINAAGDPLPSSPLKVTEKRGDRWQAMMGVEQTEIDAVAVRRPELFRQMVRDAAAPFFDDTLENRVEETRDAWREQAQAVVDDHMVERAGGEEAWEVVKADVAERLDRMRADIEEIDGLMEVDPDDLYLDLPDIDLPEAEVDDTDDEPLVNSEWDLADHIAKLRSQKAYDDDE